MEKILFWIILLICLCMVVYSLAKDRKEGIVNLILRLAAGTLGILCVNGLLNFIGTGVMVGINGFSLSILAGLGAPGFVLLYVLSIIL